MYVQVQRTVNRLNRVWESRRLHLEKQLKPKDADSRCRQVGHTQHIVVTGASEIGRMAPESMENFLNALGGRDSMSADVHHRYRSECRSKADRIFVKATPKA